MKIKMLFILTGVVAATFVACGQTNSSLTVTVYDFKAAGNIWPYGKNITGLVTADLAAETNLVLVERAQLAKALNEQALGNSGMVNPDTAAKIGQLTGVKILVSGQVIQTDENHLVIIANIIGTETGRLFADKVEGAADNLSTLASDLSRKIAQTITDQTTNLIAAAQKTSKERLDQIIKSMSGTNRPSMSVQINYWTTQGKSRPDVSANTEFGRILLQAGFAVVDVHSDSKPEIEITGTSKGDFGSAQGHMFSYQRVIELKVQDRHTGKIISVDQQTASATDATQTVAKRDAIVNAVDALAERVLPLLAQ